MKNLCKIIVTTAIALLVTCMISSCHKPDYNPEKKISKIYTSSQYILMGDVVQESPKLLQEEWIWDKNKLTTINIEGGKIDFIYDKQNYLTEIDYYGGMERILFKYKNKQLHQILIQEVGFTYISIDVTKIDNKQITEMSMEFVGGSKNKNALHISDVISPISRYLFPQAISEVLSTSIKNMMNKNEEKILGNMVITLNISYSGDNISSIIQTNNYYEDESGITMYKYDKMNNPFYKSFLYGMDNTFLTSKNNITQIEYSSEDPQNYTYKYDGEWPVEQIRTYVYGYWDTEIVIYTTYYEYQN
ncbi:MAG: hypothetical protein LBU51_05970 [Bacteroidales bacterium]|jgi:hypothetical protein|nr:hypothetical protein [Bacteroidales bacterium]